MGILYLRESWIRTYFFPCFINLYFPSSGTGFLFFSWSVKYALNFALFLNQRLLREKILIFSEILASLKLVNYTKLEVKAAYLERFLVEDWDLTTVTVSQEGLESTIISWEKIAILAFLLTRRTRIHSHLPNVAVYSPYNVENYLQFLLIFTVTFYWVGKGNVARF